MQILWDYGQKKEWNGITQIFELGNLTMDFVNQVDYKKLIDEMRKEK